MPEAPNKARAQQQRVLETAEASVCHLSFNGTHEQAGKEVAVVKTVLGSHFGGFGEFTTHFRLPILVVGLVDFHWGVTGLVTHGHVMTVN